MVFQAVLNDIFQVVLNGLNFRLYRMVLDI